MTASRYAAFLPPDRRPAAELAPEETWWSWRGHDIHIARARSSDAPARVLVIHGAGGHSEALWPIAALLADQGLDIAAVDLPLYGRTSSPDPAGVRYDDWVRLLVDLVEAEREARPLILLGASIGGMLAYEVAARSPHVAAVAATCLLDPRDWRARAHMTRFGPLGILGGPLSALARGRLARTMIPMSWVANLSKMSRNPGLSRLCATDRLGGGAKVPLGFLASYLRHRHAPPESMATPVALLHPSEDAWTPVELSMRTLRRLASPSSVVMLRQCGHFPIEEPGLTDLLTAVVDLAESVS
ncbi:alpha/beta hydrolase [Parenemella sanctibonifatiensis]|uniref:Alpha/beta hydrolase n=1 Tax=Parenemella sanctibonifatiensis TaxID=2016505 RepID=A0A255ELK9_9ACTN|nr:alpha/beta hydrolase [Parenemella sanctibonifatiensis]OYN90495.1 alpha/beta hydrolase [Parenemella sanctibonifatiensis]